MTTLDVEMGHEENGVLTWLRASKDAATKAEKRAQLTRYFEISTGQFLKEYKCLSYFE